MSSKSCMFLSVEIFKQISPISVEVIPAMREMEQDDLMFPSSQSQEAWISESIHRFW